jgi:hypothetical protein
MTTILFVHGTGVRQPAYQFAFTRFAEQVKGIRPAWSVAECYWGGPHGARLYADGASIPAGISHRSEPDDLAGLNPTAPLDDIEVALWGVLDLDPLFELRLLAAEDSASVELVPGAPLLGLDLADAARQLAAAAAVVCAAATAGVDKVFAAAVEAVLDTAAADGVLRQEGALGAAAPLALARAFVAAAVQRAEDGAGGAVPIDGAHRDALIAAIVAELGGSDRGIGATVGRFGFGLAARLGATKPLERRRVAITEAAAPAAGDVLLYLARGEPVRDFIAASMAGIDGPVVVVAHSLGGVATLEALAARQLPAVRLLVTVGSQAPFLYELNALPTLPFGAPLPAGVPPWVNVFDRRDLLAYVGAGVFPGRVEDREVDNGMPFPRSHSAYFGNDGFYAVLDEVLP